MMKKLAWLGAFLIILFSVSTVIYAKATFQHWIYEDYSTSSLYSSGIVYDDMIDTEDMFLDDQIHNVDDLYNLSSHVLVIQVTKKEIKGRGIINTAVVNRVIKSDSISEGSTIKIYDLVLLLNRGQTVFLNGSTPLEENDNYLVFLNDTKRANVKNSYIASSSLYGYISLSKKDIISDFENRTLSVSDAAKYQHIFSYALDSEIEEYNSMREEILTRYGK